MRHLTVVIMTAVLFAVPLSAQTVDEIIAKHFAAEGGMTKLKALQSVRLTGDFETGGMKAGFTQVYKRPMKMRLDISVQGLTMTQAYDGEKGWQVVPFTGKKDPEPMTGDDLKNVQEQADLDGPLMDYKKKGNTVELIGKEKIAGKDSYHLKVTLKNGGERHLYLDAGTFLGQKTVAKTPGTEVEIESILGDYREVDGLMFPFSVEQHPVGNQGPGQKITFKKIEPNAPVDDSIFKMPAIAPAPAQSQPAPSPR
ncbi:MAG: outer membrane lipoprotein-sorting protein [Candidatus Angelobacter sp.]